ncbi:hypothetical protein EDB85DRAFT_1895171 [Lactarius pseudohatsudake]|nr:hypothetical protein EDB85DRAFT_1895171 [Lactarius pseudohatsudake]
MFQTSPTSSSPTSPSHLSHHLPPNSDQENAELTPEPTDIAQFPDTLAADPDEQLEQSEVLNQIIGTTLQDPSLIDEFDNKRVYTLKLSHLERMYQGEGNSILNLLSDRHTIQIDERYRIRPESGTMKMNTSKTMIDYHLTVGSCIGFAPLLPNIAANSRRFSFDMDLKKPYRDFKAMNEDIFLAMAPNGFLSCQIPPSGPGFSTGPPLMSRRHYRQTTMMLAHFLGKIPERSYINIADVYEQDLESEQPNWDQITNVFDENTVRLNFEDVKTLDRLIGTGYNAWVDDAPPAWKADGFLQNNSPIVVTSRYGQNTAVVVPGNEQEEAATWDSERDYSKIAYLTFALATSIECTEVQSWDLTQTGVLKDNNPRGIFEDTKCTQRVDLDTFPLLNEHQQEIPVYNFQGKRIRRREPSKDAPEPQCGVLVDLENIQALFNPGDQSHIPDDDDFLDSGLQESPFVNVYAYPLGFLRVAGNIQATGVPHCFYPVVAEVNLSVREDSNESSSESDSDDDFPEAPRRRHLPPTPAVKPVAAQFYNYIAHRIAPRAGRMDSQQGSVTAALSGAFAQTPKDKRAASRKQAYCDQALPSTRFHKRISRPECPKCCRAEFVYSVDVRSLKPAARSGKLIFDKIIRPLARSWKRRDVRDVIKDFLVVFKPNVFPALFNWVTKPFDLLIEYIYKQEIRNIHNDSDLTPCPMRLEFLAALERLLCYCHTGNTAVLATSLMHPLGLSKGVLKDGFPMLLQLFSQPSIQWAVKFGLIVDPRRWPLQAKNGHPAIASKRAQILTYSMNHFLAYQAKFRISHTISVDPPSIYPGISSPNITRAARIVEIALMAFLDDTKQLVTDGVRGDIALRVSQAQSQNELQTETAYGKKRERFLKKWLCLERPLSYGQNDICETYESLIQAVVSDPRDIANGLPNWEAHGMTRSNFVALLLKMASPSSPRTQVQAPILLNGSFLPILKEAHRCLIVLSQEDDMAAQNSFFSKLFLYGIKHLRICFVPSYRPREGGRGAPNRKAMFNSWAQLGCMDTQSVQPIPQSLSLPSSSQHDAALALSNALANDCTAEWFAGTIMSLGNLHRFLHKTTLPEDFPTPTPTNEEYVDSTYPWVKDVYDGTKPLHHLALIVSIVASSFLPRLFMPTTKNLKARFVSANTQLKVRHVYNDIDWVARSKKGMTDKRLFVAMITTSIIALYEPDSPLRQHMSGSSKGGLGKAWTDKHTVKGLSYSTLLHLGMFWGKGTGAFEKGEVDELYRSLKKKLGEKPFGPFDALSLLIGDKNARFFSSHLHLSVRPPQPASTSSPSIL